MFPQFTQFHSQDRLRESLREAEQIRLIKLVAEQQAHSPGLTEEIVRWLGRPLAKLPQSHSTPGISKSG